MRLLNISLLLSALVGVRAYQRWSDDSGLDPYQPSECHNLKTNPNHVPAEKRHRLLLKAGKRVVVHVKAETTDADGDAVEWTAFRAEVVHALLAAEDGADSFEAMTRTGDDITFLDLKRDGTVLSVGEGDEETLAGAFSVRNAFVSDTPDVNYHVACPAEGEETCRITRELVECSSEEAAFLAEHVPRECLDEAYGVGLYASPGPHFFLAGVPLGPDASGGCPPSVVMNTISGEKKKYAVVAGGLEHLPRHHMGAALLGDILRAEEDAEPIEDSAYDAITNNCVHYARDIWHTLELAETEELARFIAENIVNDDSAEDYFKRNAKDFFKEKGGVRALAAVTIGDEGALEKILKTVQAQLSVPPESDGSK